MTAAGSAPPDHSSLTVIMPARTRKCPDCSGTGDVLITRPVHASPRLAFGRRGDPQLGCDQYALCLTCGGTGRQTITRKTTSKPSRRSK